MVLDNIDTTVLICELYQIHLLVLIILEQAQSQVDLNHSHYRVL